MPPLPLLVFYVGLIGYPLVQIVAISLRRARRIAFRAKIEALRQRYPTGPERAAIEGLMRDSRGRWYGPIMHMTFPFVGLAAVFSGSRPSPKTDGATMVSIFRTILKGMYRLPDDSALLSDPDLDEVVAASVLLQNYSSPISLVLGTFLAGPSLAIAYLIDVARGGSLKSFGRGLLARVTMIERATLG